MISTRFEKNAWRITFAEFFFLVLQNLNMIPERLYCNLYLLTHCSSSLLPWVATRVTVLSLPRSTCSHWSKSLLRADQHPPLFPLAFMWSLPCWGEWFSSHWDEALNWTSEISLSSTPRGSVHPTFVQRNMKKSYTIDHIRILSTGLELQ